MRKLTKADVEEYLQFSQADPARGDEFYEALHQESKFIAEAFVKSGLVEMVAREQREAGAERNAALLTNLVMVFQMGRECEARLAARFAEKPN